jgi:hypothetical protein
MDESKPISTAQTAMVKVEALKKLILRGLFIYMLVFNVFLFLRIVLRSFGADPQTIFSGFIFLVSGVFLLPFFGMFPQFRDTIFAGQGTFDVLSMIALFCTNVLLLLTMAVVQIGSTMMRTTQQATETVDRKRTVDSAIVDQSIQ